MRFRIHAAAVLGVAALIPTLCDCVPDAHAQSIAPHSDASADAPASSPRPHGVRNVVLITIDSLRADMPWSGYPHAIAPNLTEFAAHAVLYTHAYALSSYTSMSVGALLGGRYPSELRRDGQFFGHYARSNVFFPEVLHDAGIRTIAAHAHFYFRAGFASFEQGFDQYELVPTRTDYMTDRDITGDRQEPIAERQLSDANNTAGRFFAWYHFMDTHDQYLPHRGIGPYGRTLRDLYDAEVTWTDRWVGQLLSFIARQPWAGETAIIVTADHGETFGEHGSYRHGFELWQPLIRVPLMVALPGGAPRVIDANRSHLDLAPTILDLLGLPPSHEFTGTSLVAELSGGPAPDRDVIVDLPETTVSHQRRALIHGTHKLLAFDDGAHMELYDVEADPGEHHSLRRTDRALFDEMVSRFRSAQESIRNVPAPAVEHMHHPG